MSLVDDNNMVMPVTPMNGSNNGLGGDWGSWIILFLLFGMCGGWGGGFGGFGGFGGGFGYDFPWLLNGQNGINANTNAGFQNAAVQSAIGDVHNSIVSGFGDVQNAICGGFAGVNATVNGAQNAISQQLYTNQIADLERSFAAQTANTQALSGLQSQLAQCCCDNRLATCQTQNIVQNEGNATRVADANNTRDIIQSQTQGTQAILDKLCQLELDNVKSQVEAKNDRIAELQTQLNFANLAASQTAQTAQIRDGQLAATTALVNELRSCPIPSQPVYGSQPIFTCPNNNNNGCGCNSGFVG